MTALLHEACGRFFSEANLLFTGEIQFPGDLGPALEQAPVAFQSGMALCAVQYISGASRE